MRETDEINEKFLDEYDSRDAVRPRAAVRLVAGELGVRHRECRSPEDRVYIDPTALCGPAIAEA